MLARPYRFHGHGSLRYVYRNGKAVRSHRLTIKYIDNPRRRCSRFAVVISKKVHKGAVGRNRMRRRIYGWLSSELALLKPNHDVAIIVVSSELLTLSTEEFDAQLRELFSQADLYV